MQLIVIFEYIKGPKSTTSINNYLMSTLFSNQNQSKSILSSLNEKQREAAGKVEGPVLVVAGAGSGKTRVLTYRIAYMLQECAIPATEILALTFTNKAAKEMKERIKSLIGEGSSKLWMGTFHSVFSKILRIEAKAIGYDANFSIYDTDDCESVIRSIIKEMGYDPKDIKPKTIRHKISDAKNQLIGPDAYLELNQHNYLDKITGKVYQTYTERLRLNNAMDFDDLLIIPIALFAKFPNILEKYQDRFKYILIDEYQDTNRAQYVVTKQLAQKHKNLCVVGDDAQSIYAFRGADISNILNFKKDYEHAIQIPLEQNYRCTSHILQCADSIIKQNKQQLEKTLWTQNAGGDYVTLLENNDERDEANRVAMHIQNQKYRKGYKDNDFAILYRTNYQSRVFEDALRRHGIAYQLVGGISFYQRAEIKDVLAYLKVLVNPQDENSLLRIINVPARGIGNKSLNDLTQMARNEGTKVWEIISNRLTEAGLYKPAEKHIGEFVELIKTLQNELNNGMAISEVVRHLLEKTGYLTHLVQDGSQQSLNKRDNVVELQNAIAYYERATKNPKLANFLQEISLVTDADKYDENRPMVTLMTVHASKGLEFPCVFIVGLEDNLFPMGARNGEEENIEEERRLLYVAITRAKEVLYLSYAQNRIKYGEAQACMRSRFLDEIDSGVVVTETGASIKQKERNFTRSTSSVNDSTSNDYQIDTSTSQDYDYNYDWKKPIGTKTKHSANLTFTPDAAISADASAYVVGLQVLHPKFGPGKIIQRSGTGADTKVTVFFPKHGQKKLLLKFAKLQIMG